MAHRYVFILAAMLAAAASPALAQSQSDSSVPTIPDSQLEPRSFSSPFEFIATAAASNQFEIDAAEIAVLKAENADVKAFAQMMLDDHTAAQAELMAAGKADGVDIARPTPDGEQMGLLGKMEPATGAAFDAVYLQSQVFAHQRAIAAHQGYADGTSNLNTFAAKTLPKLMDHYAMAMELNARFGQGPAAQ